jgi:hypothetical protein
MFASYPVLSERTRNSKPAWITDGWCALKGRLIIWKRPENRDQRARIFYGFEIAGVRKTRSEPGVWEEKPAV